jgi:ribosomal protein S18 acetylase RimI-like enzyme
VDNLTPQPAPESCHVRQPPDIATPLDTAPPAVHAPSGAVPFTEPKKAAPRLVKATPADLTFVDSLQRKFARSLGFLPRAALEVNLASGNVTLTRENEDSAGYLLVRPVLSWQPKLASIIQAAVCMDAQRRHHGLALLLLIESEARARGQVALQANCAVGVEANEFWQAAGFKPIAHMTPATKSGRHIICWRKPLTRSLPAWFTDLPSRAGHRSRTAVSNREATRSPKSQRFAERFLSAKLLPAGDPERAGSGIILSTSAHGRQLLGEVPSAALS